MKKLFYILLILPCLLGANEAKKAKITEVPLSFVSLETATTNAANDKPLEFPAVRATFKFSKLSKDAQARVIQADLQPNPNIELVGMGVFSDKNFVCFKWPIGKNNEKLVCRTLVYQFDVGSLALHDKPIPEEKREYIVKVLIKVSNISIEEAKKIIKVKATLFDYTALTWMPMEDNVSVYGDKDPYMINDFHAISVIDGVDSVGAYPNIIGTIPVWYTVDYTDIKNHNKVVANILKAFPTGKLHDRKIMLQTTAEKLRFGLACAKNANKDDKEWAEESRHRLRMLLIRLGYDPDDPKKPWEDVAAKEFDWDTSFKWVFEK